MKCLVTGAAGFIGSHLSEALIRQGNEVCGIDCFTDYYAKSLKLANLAQLEKTEGFDFVEMDISGNGTSEHVKDVDVIFHLAAQPGVRASWGASFSHYIKDNIAATQTLLEAAKKTQLQRFVYASSSSVYGDAERFPTPEETPPSPNSPYGATKFEAELLCNVYRKNFGVPTVVLRYFTVYGPRQRPDMAFNKFISAIQRGEEVVIYGDGSQGRDFTFVLDTVAATCLSANAQPGSTYNVGTGSTVTINEVLSVLEEIIGKRAKVRKEPVAHGDVRMTCAETSKIKRELGFHPKTKIEEGLRMQVEAASKH